MQILQILWEHGPSTVRIVNEIMNTRKSVGYTTTLKIMQIMTEKDLVKPDKEMRTHVYTATVDKDDTERQLLDKFLNRTFEGSAHKLVMQTLGNHATSRDELEQIKKLIKEIEGEKDNGPG